MNAKDLPPTDLLYNDDPYAAECEASVIAASGDDLVLDRTVFYPEGGGQAADSVTLNGIPVHRLERVTISERSTPEGIPIPPGVDRSSYGTRPRSRCWRSGSSCARLGEIEIPCGGTHVRSMTELDGEPQ